MTWQLTLAGLLVGLLVGITGMGGGSLMTPLLILLFGFNPTVAVGTDIAHGAIFKTFGGLRHRALGNVQARLSGWMFLGSAPMSLLGVAIATWLTHRYGDGLASVQARVIGGALLFGAIGLFAKTVMSDKVIPDTPFVLRRRDRVAAVAIGALGGLIVGLTSVGSGTFFGLTMLVLFPLGAVKVVGTDVFHAAALLWVAGFGHFVAGNVDLRAVAWLLLGSIPAILIGSQLSVAIPERMLRTTLASVLALSGIKLLDVPHGTTIVVVGLAVGATFFIVGLCRQLLARGVAPSPQSAPADIPLEPT
jgi:uncharacterized membrane protein YfcA